MDVKCIITFCFIISPARGFSTNNLVRTNLKVYNNDGRYNLGSTLQLKSKGI
jgi:hypothetical protein